MTTRTLIPTTRGIEIARSGSRNGDEVRVVPTVVNGRSEMLPDNPFAVAKILTERRTKRSTAAKAKAKMTAALKSRGV